MHPEKKKILIALLDEQTLKALKKHPSASSYVIETAKNGTDCLNKITSFNPDLVFMELLLPHIHGMEILRRIKSNPRTKHIGVILTTAPMIIQNYQAALQLECS